MINISIDVSKYDLDDIEVYRADNNIVIEAFHVEKEEDDNSFTVNEYSLHKVISISEDENYTWIVNDNILTVTIYEKD